MDNILECLHDILITIWVGWCVFSHLLLWYLLTHTVIAILKEIMIHIGLKLVNQCFSICFINIYWWHMRINFNNFYDTIIVISRSCIWSCIISLSLLIIWIYYDGSFASAKGCPATEGLRKAHLWLGILLDFRHGLSSVLLNARQCKILLSREDVGCCWVAITFWH